MKTKQFRLPRHSQSGFSLLAVMLALVVAALIGQAQIEAQALQRKVTEGRLQGDALRIIKDAANNYVMEAYAALQQGQPVTVRGVTLAAGSNQGQAMAPTVANLIDMGYLTAGTSTVSRINSGSYRVIAQRTPLGCVASACDISGLVYIDRPVLQPGTNEIAGVQIGSFIESVGGDVVVSLPASPANVIGLDGATRPNPVGGNPAGVVGARVGFGSSGFGRFLVMNDPRNPNFQGDVSVRNNLNIGGDTSIAGNVDVNNCVKLLKDGNAFFNCYQPDDKPSGWTGGVRALDGMFSGTILAARDPKAWSWNSTNPWIAMNAAGSEAFFATNGRVDANRFLPTGLYAPGTSCPSSGSIARSSDTASGGVLVVCSLDAKWVQLSTISYTGGSCPLAGQGALDTSGRQLYCFNGVWSNMTDFIITANPGGSCTTNGALGYASLTPGNTTSAFVCKANPSGGGMRWFGIQDITTNLVFVTAYEVAHNTVVYKPTCSVGPNQTATPIAQLIPKVESSSDGGFARFVVDNGNSWTVQLTNGSGAALSASPSASAIMQVYCYYP
ncbi:type IV pilus modification PilV family protein [Variovorax ginsengisoli]|uniref:Type II secretory pathway pseudopilin PulG n=1 Tax=Variovorax ginsengisoli TaxID=363844 RepID=A0ABT9SG84_9BURK|nr:hypothetical protein [Variovorax ginsengisoli]MDP9902402.1 type II secretory pathway pseudopilin PulG [Variovorax ginsengisoli]